MDAKNITFGETAMDRLVQWLRQAGQPQPMERVVERYLELLRELVLEEDQA